MKKKKNHPKKNRHIDELDHLASLLTPTESTSAHSRIAKKCILDCITINNTFKNEEEKKSSPKKLSRGIDELDLLASLLTPAQSTSTHSMMVRQHIFICYNSTLKRKKRKFHFRASRLSCCVS